MRHFWAVTAVVGPLAAAGCSGPEEPAPAGTSCADVVALRMKAQEASGIRGLAAGGAGAMPVLAWIMTGPDTADAIAAAEEAAAIGPPAIPGLLAILDSNASRGRGWAAWALGEMGPKAAAALPSLEKAADDGAAGAAAREAILKIKTH